MRYFGDFSRDRAAADPLLHVFNRTLYAAYLNDRPPLEGAPGDFLYRPPGLAMYWGDCETTRWTKPVQWKFRLRGVRCRSRRLAHLLKTGSEVSELALDGLESAWREDLLLMAERRKPVAGWLTMPMDFFAAELEMLVLPFFRKGAVERFVGAFAADDMSIAAIGHAKELGLSRARRLLRSRALDWPRPRRFDGAGGRGGKFWRAVRETLDAETPPAPVAAASFPAAASGRPHDNRSDQDNRPDSAS